MEEVRVKTDSFFLIPGIGAQGGSLKNVMQSNINHLDTTLVNISRGIIFADQKNSESIRLAAKKYLNQMKESRE